MCRPEENLRGCGRAFEIRLLIRTGFRKDFRLPIVISQCKHSHAECLIRLKKLETTDGLAALNEKTHITLCRFFASRAQMLVQGLAQLLVSSTETIFAFVVFVDYCGGDRKKHK